MEQGFVKDPDTKVGDLLKESGARILSNSYVLGLARAAASRKGRSRFRRRGCCPGQRLIYAEEQPAMPKKERRYSRILPSS